MFFLWWTREWTQTLIVGLLTTPLNQKEEAPTGWFHIVVEVLTCVLVWFPCALVWGQATVRIAAQWSRTMGLARSLWTCLVQMASANVVVAILLYSVSTTRSNNGPAATAFFWLRFITVVVGIYWGEQFVPMALTGGIACGKSTVSQLFREKCYMIDSDAIGHLILLPPWHAQLQQPESPVGPSDSVYHEILQTFGEGENGTNSKHSLLDEHDLIDRTKLGALVFGNPAQRQKLNRITHGRILKTLLKRVFLATYFHNDKPWVCAEIPLLFESGPLRYLFVITMAVACSPEQQLARLQARNPELTPQQCQERIDSQMPVATKVQLADLVVSNERGTAREGPDLQALQQQVERVQQQWRWRVYGLLGVSLSQMVLLLMGSLVLSTWANMRGYNMWTTTT